MLITHTKKHSKCFLLACILICTNLQLQAQQEPDFLAFVDNTSSEASSPTSDKAAYYFRHFRKLPSTYQGYLIELTLSEEPLRRDYHLFQYFGNVYYLRLKDGKIAYYILGKEFKSKGNVKHFIKNIVRHHAPDARLVVKRKI